MSAPNRCHSGGGELLWLHLRGLGLADGAVPEYAFAPGRRFRFDVAWPARKIALEVDGGVWTGGRHTRGRGATSDAEKFSLAAILGWRVLRATTQQVRSGQAVAWVQAALAAERTA